MPSRGVNKVILLGNLGQNPESRTTQNGNTVVSVRIATNEPVKDKASGGWKTVTSWHRVVAWGPYATTLLQHTAKGDTIYIEGRLQTRKWQDKGGSDRWTTEVVVQSLVLLGRPTADGKAGDSEEEPAHHKPPHDDVTSMFAGADDDLPF